MFTKRTVIDAIGSFDSRLMSSGDNEWGQRAFRAGYILSYSEKILIRHPARNTAKEFYEKVSRISHGLVTMKLLRNYPVSEFIMDTLKNIFGGLARAYRVCGLSSELSPTKKFGVVCVSLSQTLYSSYVATKTYFGFQITPNVQTVHDVK